MTNDEAIKILKLLLAENFSGVKSGEEGASEISDALYLAIVSLREGKG